MNRAVRSGLALAILGIAAVTLLLVPVLYSIFVLDLKLVKWDAAHPEAAPEADHETRIPSRTRSGTPAAV